MHLDVTPPGTLQIIYWNDLNILLFTISLWRIFILYPKGEQSWNPDEAGSDEDEPIWVQTQRRSWLEKKRHRKKFCQDTADHAKLCSLKRKKAAERRIANQEKNRKTTAKAMTIICSKHKEQQSFEEDGSNSLSKSSSKKKKKSKSSSSKSKSKAKPKSSPADNTPAHNHLTNYFTTPTASTQQSNQNIPQSTISTAASSNPNYQSDDDTTMTPSYYLNHPSTPPAKKLPESMMANTSEVKLGICHGCKMKFDECFDCKYCDICLHAILDYIKEVEADMVPLQVLSNDAILLSVDAIFAFFTSKNPIDKNIGLI